MEVPVRSVRKALDLLGHLISASGDAALSLTDLAQRQRLPLNTTRNLLKSMIACGWVEQDERQRYRPGARCRDIGQSNRWRELAGQAGAVVEALGRELGEYVVFAVLAGGNRRVIGAHHPDSEVRVVAREAEDKPIYALSTGRVLCAYADAAGLGLIRQVHGEPAWEGVSGPAAFARWAVRMRDDGHYLRPHVDSLSLAVPALAPDGRCVGALGCTAPRFRCGPARQRRLLTSLHRAAALLGGLS